MADFRGQGKLWKIKNNEIKSTFWGTCNFFFSINSEIGLKIFFILNIHKDLQPTIIISIKWDGDLQSQAWERLRKAWAESRYIVRSWQMTDDRWQMLDDRWQIKYDRWWMTVDEWQMMDNIYIEGFVPYQTWGRSYRKSFCNCFWSCNW